MPDEVVVAVGVTTPHWQQVDVEMKNVLKGPLSPVGLALSGTTPHLEAIVRTAEAPLGPYVAVLLRWEGDDPTKSDDIFREALGRARAYLTAFSVLVGERAVMPVAVRILELTSEGAKEQGWSQALQIESNVESTSISDGVWNEVATHLKALERHDRKESVVLACGWHDRAGTIPEPADAFLAEFLALQALITSYRGFHRQTADSERAMFRRYSTEVLQDGDGELFRMFSRLWEQRHRLFKFGLRDRVTRADYGQLRGIVARALRAELGASPFVSYR